MLPKQMYVESAHRKRRKATVLPLQARAFTRESVATTHRVCPPRKRFQQGLDFHSLRCKSLKKNSTFIILCQGGAYKIKYVDNL